MRIGARPDGLAVPGRATLGDLAFELPVIFEATPDGRAGAGRASLSMAAAPSGMRRFRLSDGQRTLELELPVLAPEVTPVGSGVVPVDDRIVLLHAPLDPQALRALRSRRPELLVLGNARALWNDGAALVAAVRAIRSEVGAEPLLWGPRVALPHRLPLLTYLGFDLLDTTEGELRASEGELLDLSLGPRPDRAGGPRRGCDCPACTTEPPGPLVEHARFAYARALTEVLSALDRGTLRELVEARLAAEPASAELLRYADRDLAQMLESRAPVTGAGTRTYVLAESLRRPEMRRFRERLIERYRPPASKDVLLLVPCSRTKPYRRSPSHRRFASALDGQPGAQRVHVVSISSPIGVVPRELEDVPPARHYDIPVTGEWSAEERAIVLGGIQHLLGTGAYRRVIAHLDPEEYGFVLDALPDALAPARPVVDGRPTAGASLGRLRDAVAQALAGGGRPAGGPLAVVAEELREVASVQFGRPAADRLFAPPLRLAGRPWFQRLTDGRHDLASVREERGLFHLTVDGAIRLGELVARVDVDLALTLEGDVFAPGVRDAAPEIRAGDSVGVFQDGVLRAVGEAVLPGPLLGDLRRGTAVRIRHRRRSGPDTAKTDGHPSGAGR